MFNDQPVEAPPGDAWKRPNDFDWLAEGQSPNWTIAPEEEWETAVVNSSSQWCAYYWHGFKTIYDKSY